jgi:tetratricopeptide (TPR) repeat protein
MKTELKNAIEHYSSGDFQKAIEILSALGSSDDSEVYNILAMSYYGISDIKNSILYLEKALELNPEDSNYINNLAVAYLTIDKPKAIEIFHQVLKKDINSPFTNKTLGDIYYSSGDIKKAIIYYDRVLNHSEFTFDVIFNFINILYTMGEHTHSLQYIDKALSMEPNHAELILLSADTYYQLNIPSQATHYYKKYLSMQNVDMDYYTFSKIKRCWANNVRSNYKFSKIKENTYLQAYKKSIDENVKDKVVLSFATDGGLFAMMALQSGAKKVYIIEKNKEIKKQIAQIINLNGYMDSVEFITKPLFQIEKLSVDVVIVDRFGDCLVDENIMNDLRFISGNFLNKDAKILPRGAKMYGMAIDTPMVSNGYKEFGFDMSTFDIYEAPYIYKNLNEIEYEKASESFEMFDFDFYKASLFEHKIIKPNYIKEGANGVVVWYELDFETHNLNTFTQKKNNFKQLIWSINLKKEINLEIVFNKNHIFIGSYISKEDKK